MGDASADAGEIPSVKDLAESIDIFFILVCTILVLMMQAGFALYEVGTIRRTPVEVILIKNIVDASIAYASWFAVGSMFAGNGNRFIGWADAGPFLAGDEYTGDDSSLAYVRFLFSAAFAGTAVTVMSGSVADRVPYLLYGMCEHSEDIVLRNVEDGHRNQDAVWTCAFTYPVVAHWAWSEDGWMSQTVGAIGNCGVLDFAGSGVVHCFAGTATFVWAYLLPDREGRFVGKATGRVNSVSFGYGFALQDRTQQALGMFLLWLGWFGFNCGSALSITSSDTREIVSIVAVNTSISPVVCCLTSVAIEWAYFKNWLHVREQFVMWSSNAVVRKGADREQLDLHSAAVNGILSGLVGITAGCATTDPRLTIVCAVVSAFIYHYGYRLQLHHGLDDAVNAVPVHLYCGIWGLFFAALMYSPERHDTLMRVYGIDESRGGCGRGDQVAANLAFSVVVLVWSGATSSVLFYVLSRLFPKELKALDAGTRVELSDFMHVIDAVQLHIAGAQNATGAANPNPVGPPSSHHVDNPAAAAPRH